MFASHVLLESDIGIIIIFIRDNIVIFREY